MSTYTTFFSVFVLAALHTGHVYCETCNAANQTFTCLENFECCGTECCKITHKSTTILSIPELIGVIVSVLIAAVIAAVIVICICAKCRKARKEAASRPPEYVYPPPTSPSVYYSEAAEYGPRTNPYHANKQWQDRRAWSMSS